MVEIQEFGVGARSAIKAMNGQRHIKATKLVLLVVIDRTCDFISLKCKIETRISQKKTWGMKI